MREDAKALLARGEDPGAVKKKRRQEEDERRAVTFNSLATAFTEKCRSEGRAEAAVYPEPLLKTTRRKDPTRPAR